jgi:hypothetical protein
VFRLFRPGHPSLFVPWSEIQVAAHSQGLIFKSRKLLLGRQEFNPASCQVILGGETPRSGRPGLASRDHCNLSVKKHVGA